MTEKDTQLEAGLASDLNRKLEPLNNMMQYWIENTELSHYLTSLVDEGNLSAQEEYALNSASSVIDELRHEVERLQSLIVRCQVAAQQNVLNLNGATTWRELHDGLRDESF